MNFEGLMEAEAVEALAARRLLTAAGVRLDAAAPSDLDNYRLARARAEELRRHLTDKMVVVGSREWGHRGHRNVGPYRGPATREVMAEVRERNAGESQ